MLQNHHHVSTRFLNRWLRPTQPLFNTGDKELREDRETGQRIGEVLKRFADDSNDGAALTELVAELEDLYDWNEQLYSIY